MRLPTREEFDAVRFALWNTFEILLMVLAMVAVVMVAVRHIPWTLPVCRPERRRRGTPSGILGASGVTPKPANEPDPQRMSSCHPGRTSGDG